MELEGGSGRESGREREGQEVREQDRGQRGTDRNRERESRRESRREIWREIWRGGYRESGTERVGQREGLDRERETGTERERLRQGERLGQRERERGKRMGESCVVRLLRGEHVVCPRLRVWSSRNVNERGESRWLLTLRQGEEEASIEAMLTPEASQGVSASDVSPGSCVVLRDYVVEEGGAGRKSMVVVLELDVAGVDPSTSLPSPLGRGGRVSASRGGGAYSPADSEPGSAVTHAAMCGVCLEVMVDPSSLGCGHNFCVGCLERVVAQKEGGQAARCPSCRATIKAGGGTGHSDRGSAGSWSWSGGNHEGSRSRPGSSSLASSSSSSQFAVNTMLRDLIRERFPEAFQRRHEAQVAEETRRRMRAELEAEVRAMESNLGQMLVDAAGRGDGKAVDALLEKGADVNWMVVDYSDGEDRGGEEEEEEGEGEGAGAGRGGGGGGGSEGREDWGSTTLPVVLGLRTAYTAAVENGHMEVARAVVAHGGSEEPLASLVAGVLFSENTPRYVVREALEALDVLGPGLAKGQISIVAECLKRALDQGHDSVAVAALRALGSLADDEQSALRVLPAVRQVLDSSLNSGSTWSAGPGYNHEVDSSVLRASLGCLEKLDAGVGDVVELYENWLGGDLGLILRSLLVEAEVGRDSWDWETQVACLKLISRLRRKVDEATLCAVASCMGSSDDEAVKEAAFKCLRRIGEERGPGALDGVYGEVAKQVDDYHFKVRRNACVVMGTLKGEVPLQRAVVLLKGLPDDDGEVRVACARSIAGLLEEAAVEDSNGVSEYLKELVNAVDTGGCPSFLQRRDGPQQSLAEAMLGGTSLAEWVSQGRGPAHCLAELSAALGRKFWKKLIAFLTHPAVLAEAPESCLLSLSALQSPEACAMAVQPLARIVAGRPRGVGHRVKRVAIQALADASAGAAGLPRREPPSLRTGRSSRRRSRRATTPSGLARRSTFLHSGTGLGFLEGTDSSDESDESDESDGSDGSDTDTEDTDTDSFSEGEDGEEEDFGPESLGLGGGGDGNDVNSMLRRAAEARVTYLRERRSRIRR